MNILKKLLVLASVAAVSLTSVANADSSVFSGPYVALQASMIGVEVPGKHTDDTLNTKKTTKASPGMVGAMGSVQAGYNAAVSDMAFITIGATHTPTGDAEFAAKSLGGTVAKFDLVVENMNEVFIEPSFMVTSNAAVFAHVGYAEMDIDVKGTNVLNKKTTLEGTTVSLGLKAVTDSNMFVKVEAGMTEYDTLKITGILDGDGGTSAKAEGDPTIAFGTFSVGYKF